MPFLIRFSLGTDVSDIFIEQKFGTSDHAVINFTVGADSPAHVEKMVVLFLDAIITKQIGLNFANFYGMANFQVNWKGIFLFHDIGEVWRNFKDALTEAIDPSIPQKKRMSWGIQFE